MVIIQHMHLVTYYLYLYLYLLIKRLRNIKGINLNIFMKLRIECKGLLGCYLIKIRIHLIICGILKLNKILNRNR